MKKYYFSAAKNAHNIQLVMYCAYNRAQDAIDRGDKAEYVRLMSIHHDAQEVLTAISCGMVSYGVCQLDGRMYGRAMEMSARGVSLRDELNALAMEGED